jgi:hypothetical protein
MTEKSFGRRATFELRPLRPSPAPRAFVSRAAEAIDTRSIGQASLAQSEIVSTSDDELCDWKQARRQGYQVPWRQLSLMASLCFGAATFVLPDTVSDTLDWLLYCLMAASFVAGIRRRRERT